MPSNFRLMNAIPDPPPTVSDSFDYLQRRVMSQRKWHAAKATWNKQRFYAMEITTLVAGVLIPVVNLLALGTY